MKKSEALFGALRVPLDALAVLASLVLSYKLRQANVDLIPGVQLLEQSGLPPFAYYFEYFVIPGMCLFLIIASFLRMYALQLTTGAWNEIGNIMLAGVLWLVFVMAWYFLVVKQLFYSRILLIHSLFFITLFVAVLRSFLTLLQRNLLRRGIGVRSVLSIGRVALAESARKTLEDDIRYSYIGHAKTFAELEARDRKDDIDLVLETDPSPDNEDTMRLIEYCRSHHIGYAFLPPVFIDVPRQLSVEHLGLIPMLRFTPTPLDGWGRIFKRLFDIVVSGLALILLSPFLIGIAIAVVATSGFPILYISTRVGEQGRRRIPVLKFRSMSRDADQRKEDLQELNHRTDGPLFKIKNDPRITPLGAFLRRWSIDELPQLLNVFFGQMSLVGPRPHLPEEVKLYSDYQRRVFAVKPGLTGLAQVSGRSDLKFDEEVSLDLQYIEEWSLLMDVWILWRTLVVVCGRKGAD